MKKRCFSQFREKSIPVIHGVRRLILMMKLISLFLIIACMNVSASIKAQTISLNFKNEALTHIFKTIEKQTDFVVVYNDRFVNPSTPVSIAVNNVPLTKALEELLRPLKLTYHITEKTIVIAELPKQNDKPVKDRVITGKITDEKGIPLQGATIGVKGTTIVTTTDARGSYQIRLPTDAKVLVFTNIGFKTLERTVDTQDIINVSLEPSTVVLQEVVAVGYGTVRRRDLTGSVSSIKGDDLKDIPVTSISQALVGRMPGVQITKTEGSPDAEVKIRVRGGGSLTQDNSPLYIVDGFPVDDINNIATSDIASVDVLKDASSTAIYGARGANGVVLITTRIGSEGTGKISYNNYFGVKEITKTLDVLNPSEFVFWQYELDQTTAFERYYGSFQDIDLYKQVKGTNWQNEIFGRTGTSGFHNLSFSGGAKVTKYNVSLTRNDEKEIMLGSGFARTNLNVRTNNKVNDWLSIDLNLMLSDNATKGAGTSANSRLPHAVLFRPVQGLAEFVDDDLADPADFEASMVYNKNPVLQTNDDYRRSKALNFNFNGAANITFSKNLSYRLEFGNIYRQNTNRNFYGLNTSNVNEFGGVPIANISNVNSKRYRLANSFTYTKRNIHPGGNLTAVLGQELVSFKSESTLNSAKYFPKFIDAVSALSMMQLGTADPIMTADNPADKLSSVFGRINYDFLGKYLFSATLRADGSSKFARGNQWGFFPSAALAWRISDEHFMLSTEGWLSELKLRTSFGQSGNNRISDNAWQKTFSVTTGNIFISGDENTRTPFLSPNGVLSNPSLKWETTQTINVGVDFGLLKQRITGSIELYKNITRDLLISATIPATTGYATQWQNIGQTSNRGVELNLNAQLINKKDLKLNASFNIGFNRNRIDKLGDAKQWEQTSMWYGWIGTGTVTGDYLVREGGQIGEMYGYRTAGYYTFDDFNYNTANGTYTLKPNVPSNSALINSPRFWPGALKFENQNGDNVVNSEDKVVIGNANPKHTGGFNLAFKYKGVDFSTFFNWVYGNDIYNANKVFFSSLPFNYKHRNLLDVMNSGQRFTYFNRETGALVSDPAQLAEMNKNAKLWSPAMNNLQLHSWGIEDGSFLRLNTVTLGYSFPTKKILSKLHISQLRLYAVAYNVWTWTNYSGYDPEVDVVTRTPLTPGIDWSAYPRSRTYNIGLNVTF